MLKNRDEEETQKMKKETYLRLLQDKIDELNKYLARVPENEPIEKALTLGKINSFLIARLYALELDD